MPVLKIGRPRTPPSSSLPHGCSGRPRDGREAVEETLEAIQAPGCGPETDTAPKPTWPGNWLGPRTRVRPALLRQKRPALLQAGPRSGSRPPFEVEGSYGGRAGPSAVGSESTLLITRAAPTWMHVHNPPSRGPKFAREVRSSGRTDAHIVIIIIIIIMPPSSHRVVPFLVRHKGPERCRASPNRERPWSVCSSIASLGRCSAYQAWYSPSRTRVGGREEGLGGSAMARVMLAKGDPHEPWPPAQLE